MAKRIAHKKGKSRKKVKEIDHIPKCYQQRRSPAPKRRTDFSIFLMFSSSSSASSSSSVSNALLNQDSLMENSCHKKRTSTVTKVTLDDKKSNTKDISKLPSMQPNNQALKSGHPSSHTKLYSTPDKSNNSNEQDTSGDKTNSLGSIQTESDFLENRRRGTRTRKPKVHFDEVPLLSNSTREARRLKIMRLLGLIAPLGSPFSLNHV